MKLFFAVGLVAMAFAECGSEESENNNNTVDASASSSSSSSSSGGESDAGDGGPSVCDQNQSLMVPDSGAGIGAMKAARNLAPTPAGGTFVEGIYALTSSTFYTDGPMGAGSDTARGKLRLFANGTFAYAYRHNNDPENLSGGTYDFDATAKTITFHTTCLRSGLGYMNDTPKGYTFATPDGGGALTFRTIQSNGGNGTSEVIYTVTYTKQN